MVWHKTFPGLFQEVALVPIPEVLPHADERSPTLVPGLDPAIATDHTLAPSPDQGAGLSPLEENVPAEGIGHAADLPCPAGSVTKVIV